MAKTDIFGYFKPEIYNVKKSHVNLSFYAMLLVRSELNDWELLMKIYHLSHYTLKIAPLGLDIYQDNRFNVSFPVYMDNETIDNEFFLLIKNYSIQKSDYQLIGSEKNVIYTYKQKKVKPKLEQLNIFFDDESDVNLEQFEDEIYRWNEFKEQLKKQSISSLSRIDFFIPLTISTYQYFIPLFKQLHLLSEIKYMCIEASAIDNFEEMYYKFELYKDALRNRLYKQESNAIDMIFKQNK